MVATDANISPILSELLGLHGASLRVVPASTYIERLSCVSFFQVAETVQVAGDLLIGYQDTQATCINPGQKANTALSTPAKDVPIYWEGKSVNTLTKHK